MRPPTIITTTTTFQAVIVGGLSSFFECALYFAFVIQIATITILAPKDLETKRSSVGEYEVRIAGIVSTASLLPLLAPIPLLSSTSCSIAHGGPSHDGSDVHARHPYRLSMLALTVSLSVYTFFSQSIRYWAPSSIGESKGDGGVTYVTEDEWRAVERVCFGSSRGATDSADSGVLEIPLLSSTEHIVLGALHMVASLTVLLFTVFISVPVILRRVQRVRKKEGQRLQWSVREKTKWLVDSLAQLCRRRWARCCLVGVPFCLAAPLLWGFWRLRSLQEQLALAVRGHYEGNDWGFGQVMAIAVFAPVVAEMLFVLVRKFWDGVEELEGEGEGGEIRDLEQPCSNGDDQRAEESVTARERGRFKTY